MSFYVKLLGAIHRWTSRVCSVFLEAQVVITKSLHVARVFAEENGHKGDGEEGLPT